MITISVSPRLIKQFGKNLYSGDPISIALRELVQNAIDACRRRKVKPDIAVCIRRLAADIYEISCSDNGIGMNDEQIVSDFLCIGGTSKKDDSKIKSIGRFGVASTIVFGADNFDIRTLNYHYTKAMLDAGDDIEYVEQKLNGTTIKMTIQAKNDYGYSMWWCRYLVYTSDVDIQLSMINSDGTAWHEDSHAGYTSTDETVYLDDDKMKIRIFGNINGMEGISAVRIGGLTQFCEKSYGRTTNLIFDIKLPDPITDENYPLNMSREKLRDAYESTYREALEFHNRNLSTSTRMLEQSKKKAPEKSRIVRAENKALGLRDESATFSKLAAQIVAAKGIADTSLILNMARANHVELNPDQVQQLVDAASVTEDNVALTTDEWYVRDTTKTTFRTSIFKCWFRLIKICASNQELFGVGFSGWYNRVAARKVENGILFYMVNPDIFEQMIANKHTSRALALKLWHTACHEAAHGAYQNHDELWAETEGDIATQTCGAFFEMLPSLCAILEKGVASLPK